MSSLCRVKSHWGRTQGRVEGSGTVQPPSRAGSDWPHPPPPPTPSAFWTDQQGGGGGGGGGGLIGSNSPIGKKVYSKKKKRVLHVDLHGDPQLEQSSSEVQQTRSRSQTPRSRPASHNGHGRFAGSHRRGTSTPVNGASVVEQLDGSKQGQTTEGQTTEGASVQEKLAFRSIRVDCHGVAIQPMNIATEVTKERQESGKMMRDTEREIAALLSRRRTCQVRHTQPALTRDQLLFANAYVSVATCALKTLEDLGHLKRNDEVLARKTALVTRLKEDRVCRAERVEALRQSLKEGIHAWKDRHIEVLLKKKQAVATEKGSIASCHAAMRDREALRARMIREGREFEMEFNMQNVAIGGALADEDKRTVSEARLRDVRVMVEERREELERGAALVKDYLRRREAHLSRKSVNFKKDLEAKMCQVSDMVKGGLGES